MKTTARAAIVKIIGEEELARIEADVDSFMRTEIRKIGIQFRREMRKKQRQSKGNRSFE
jgi:hypothetical protein